MDAWMDGWMDAVLYCRPLLADVARWQMWLMIDQYCSKAIPMAAYISRVSTPHPISGIRRVEYVTRPDETKAERQLRKRLAEDQEFHHQFWLQNNMKFRTARTKFIECHQNKEVTNGRLPPHVMSRFYCQFLETHRKEHAQYNLELWRRTLTQIPLYIMAFTSRVGRTIAPSLSTSISQRKREHNDTSENKSKQQKESQSH
eukprot:gene4213-6559_t